MSIRTNRLFLRELESADCCERYVAWLNDPEVNRFLETRHTRQTLATVTQYVEGVAARGNEFLYGIFRTEDGRHIGNIKIGPIHRYHRVADISLFIGERDCWGRGYASEAIDAVSRHAFEVLGVEKLSASMYEANQGSFRAFLKVGYCQEGLRRAHYRLGDARSDIVELGLCADALRRGAV